MTNNNINQDVIYKGLLFDDQVAFYAINGTQICEDAKNTLKASATCTAAIGRALMGTNLMAIMHKDENYKITTVFKGGGPAGSIVCVANNSGIIKGYVTNPHIELPPNHLGKLDVGGVVGNAGTLRVIADLGANTQPYTGETPLVSGEIAEDIAQYFISSTQTPSLVYLGVHISKDFVVESASGIIITPLPFCSEEVLQKLEELAPQIATQTKQLKNFNSLQIALNNIFKDCDIKYTQTIENPEYKCDCSKDRLEKVLIALGEEELQDMIKAQNGAQLNCQFCKTSYNFSAQELRNLILQAKIN